MATYLKYFVFLERLCTEHKTMTESTRPWGCHFIVQKADILATTGMKATFDFTLKKSENKYAELTIWRTNPPLTWGPGKLNTAINLIYIFQLLVINNEREWFYNQNLKSIVTRWCSSFIVSYAYFKKWSELLSLQTKSRNVTMQLKATPWAVLCCGAVYCAVQGASNFCVCEWNAML